jgi:hypothetical protein
VGTGQRKSQRGCVRQSRATKAPASHASDAKQVPAFAVNRGLVTNGQGRQYAGRGRVVHVFLNAIPQALAQPFDGVAGVFSQLDGGQLGP